MAYLQPYWAKFKGLKSGCIEAETEDDAKAQAEKMGEFSSLKRLPYPASPRLSEKHSDCPSFCFTPEQCQGRTSCPRARACDD